MSHLYFYYYYYYSTRFRRVVWLLVLSFTDPIPGSAQDFSLHVIYSTFMILQCPWPICCPILSLHSANRSEEGSKLSCSKLSVEASSTTGLVTLTNNEGQTKKKKENKILHFNLLLLNMITIGIKLSIHVYKLNQTR